ncbi:MAG TPA: amino acid permease [Acidimicrobiales bacterium]|nr:amino acid permease [Acidimicrobiales bacterium]
MSDPPTRLERRIGTADAIVIGLGSMIGAGVFAALAPAAQSAGGGLLVGLAIAAAVAFANATSSAQLGAIHPQAGGTYVYGRARLGPGWGFAAGWGFVAGKTASCAAMALTFGAYAWPQHPRVMAALAVAALVAVNLAGVTKTVWLTRLIVAIVLCVLTIVVIAGFTGGTADIDRVSLSGASPYDCLRAGALLFFAFAGYARLATLGEEVRDPARTIPRAIPAALGITLLVYALVALSALVAVGPDALAASDAPLARVVDAGSWHDFVPLVRFGAATASLGVLLSLLAGVSRTIFAMAGERDLPRVFAHVQRRTKVPDLAETAVGCIVLVAVLTSDIRDAIGFSSFCVLGYYAITNAAALRLPREQRRWPAAFAAFGLAGCVVLAVTLPTVSIVGGIAAIGVGLVGRYAVAQFKPVDRS